VYCLESWQDRTAVAEVRGSDLRGALLAELVEAGSPPAADRTYKVATTAEAATERADELFGSATSWRTGSLLRETAIEYLAHHGFGDGA
jgi:hypothetical protein